MSIVNAQPYRIPLVDPKTGVITMPWTKFFQQVFERIGGAEGQTNTELVQDAYADAGIEEMKAEFFKLIDESRSGPPPITQLQQDDQSARLEAIEAQMHALFKEIDALKQGYQP